MGAKLNYIERKTRELADASREDLVAQIINRDLNDLVSSYADYKDGEHDAHGHGKRIPYIGWYWRSVDFASGYYVIGDCGEFIGFMENNKWGYPSRRLTPDEAAKVTQIVCRAYEHDRGGGILADIIANTTKKLDELWPLLQSLPMTVEGFWIYGPQGQVGFAESEEEADRTIAALEDAGGIPYRKVAASV